MNLDKAEPIHLSVCLQDQYCTTVHYTITDHVSDDDQNSDDERDLGTARRPEGGEKVDPAM